MEKKDFPKGTKPREIFVYTCERIAEPLNPLGYKYRKSKNDIYKKDGIFVFSFYFSPSIRFGSTTFTAFFDVSSPVIAQWRSEQEGTEETYDGIVGTSIARLTHRYDDFPRYEVSTLLERERSIQEISGQIQDYALPFFARFSNLPSCWTMWNRRGSSPIGRGSMSLSGIGSHRMLPGVSPKAVGISRKETTPMSNSRVSTWSGIRNKLENDYLCPALRGHIQYFATSYSKSADHEGRAAIRVDGVEVLRSNYYTYFENVWTKFHHLRSTTLKDHDSAKEAINQAHAYALEQGTFDQKVFYEAFGIFDNQSIEKSLVSENPLVRIFALLDRRLGKRRLLALEDSMEQELDWVRAFYVIRLQAEGLMEANNI